MERSDERFDTSMAATKQGVWTTLTWGLLVFAAATPHRLVENVPSRLGMFWWSQTNGGEAFMKLTVCLEG